MHGRLTEFTVADLLQLYQIAGKIGTLRVIGETGDYTLYLDRGLVTGVGAAGWHLIDELRRLEWLTPGVREQIDLLEGDGGFVGLSLIARALLTPPNWEQFVERQIEELVYPLFTWTDGEFIAEVDLIPSAAPLRVQQPPQQLILNAARWDDGLRQAIRDGFGPETVWQRSGEPLLLDQMHDRLIALLHRPRTLADLAAAAGLSIIHVIERIRALSASGTVEAAQSDWANIRAGD